jgi:hypothetical protein
VALGGTHDHATSLSGTADGDINMDSHNIHSATLLSSANVSATTVAANNVNAANVTQVYALTGNNYETTIISVIDQISLVDENSFIDMKGGNLSMDDGNILGVTDIGTGTITATGDITSNGNIVGDSATNITVATGIFTNLPSSDPYIVGKLWNSSGDCKVSLGNKLNITVISTIYFNFSLGSDLKSQSPGTFVTTYTGFSAGAHTITTSVTSGYTYTFTSFTNGGSVGTTTWDGSTSNAMTLAAGVTACTLTVASYGNVRLTLDDQSGDLGTVTATLNYAAKTISSSRK